MGAALEPRQASPLVRPTEHGEPQSRSDGHHRLRQPARGLDQRCELDQFVLVRSLVHDAATARFRAGPDAPSAARRFVTSLLGCRPYDDRAPADDAQLVVSELATNAVVQAGSPFSVSVRYDGSAIRIAVHDWNPMLPLVRGGGRTAVSGRGLHLVSMLARDWGVETSPDGKTVWAELALL
jgi:histidine kinase-like protein